MSGGRGLGLSGVRGSLSLSEQCPGHEDCQVPEAGSELGYKERVWEGGRTLQ